ncbi:MAG: HU family DNA-binding protein [Bacteroidales bacterium]
MLNFCLKAMQRSNPRDLAAQKLFYVTPESAGDVTLEELSDLISEKCTLTEIDVLAVLTALTKEMTTHLMQGKIVRFGTFGSFQVGIRSSGVATEGEVSRGMVKNARVLFRPCKRIKKGLGNIEYTLKAK